MTVFNIDKKSIKKTPKNYLQGFSLGELLIVITLIALLAITALLALQHQSDKAYDATRKDHLKKYRIAFEDYYNDHNCYPSKEMWEGCECGKGCLSPYMESFLCDPNTGEKYYYYLFNDANGNPDPCMGYRLYAKLYNSSDDDIITVGCSPTRGCGDDAILSTKNYGISMGGPLTADGFNPNATPTPTSWAIAPGCASADGPHSCNTAGVCNGFAPEDFSNGRCAVGFKTGDCCVASGCPTIIRCKW